MGGGGDNIVGQGQCGGLGVNLVWGGVLTGTNRGVDKVN